MDANATSRNHARRNRMIAIAAGAITVIAIVLGFAGDFLGLPWHWVRPAAELLLLAELVGLVVLERHQLFEPVHERVENIHATLERLTQQIGASGKTTVYGNSHELIEGLARTTRLALARDHKAPQTLRIARLLGHYVAVENDPEFGAQLRGWTDAVADYELAPGSRSDSRVRWWSIRSIFAVADIASFNFGIEQLRGIAERHPLNREAKPIIRSKVEAVISPALITDREVISRLTTSMARYAGASCLRARNTRPFSPDGSTNCGLGFLTRTSCARATDSIRKPSI
jgi:hypothetical protein